MGAKISMLAYSDGDARAVLRSAPVLDRPQSERFAKTLFAGAGWEVGGDGDLLSSALPAKNEIYVGCFPGLRIVTAAEVGIDYPSRLPARFLRAGAGVTLSLVAMHSVVDWFAFAVWEAGELRRSLSVSPDSGVIEDIGAQMLFEEPFWAGRKPISDDPEEAAQYPLPFHPLDLGEAALRELFDFQIEGEADAGRVQPEAIPLVGFRRRNPWWRFW